MPHSDPLFPDSMTLGEARDVLREHVEEGHTCPTCTLFAKVYKHPCDSAMARTLIVMYRAGGLDRFLHAPSLPGDNHKVSQLAWWDLVEEEKGRRPDGGRKGYWRLTEQGRDFVLGSTTIQKYARIYDARVLGYVGKFVTIQDALGKRFNYRDLMNDVVNERIG